LADRVHGAPTPKTETTITGADWSDTDISGQTHSRVLFLDLDLTESVNNGAVFEECTFRRVLFNVSVHTDAAFVNCTFNQCSFFETLFKDCKLVGSMFDRCTYDLLKVDGGNWSFAGLPGADLRAAKFSRVRLREADLTGIRAEGGSLLDLDLTGASLHNADLTRCDLRGSDLSALDPWNVKLTGAIVDFDQMLVIAQAMGLDVR
jgi:fluoroquinolone resistance protein